MNVFDTKHNYSVQESLHLIATPPLSLGKVIWIFKYQDNQRISPSEKAFFSTPPPPPPLQPPKEFFFSHVPQKYNNNQSSWGSDPLPTSFKRANYSLNTNYLRSFWNQCWVGSWIFTLNFMFFSKSSYLGDKIHTGFLELSFEVQTAQDTHTIWVCNRRHFIIIVNALDLPFA